MNKNLNFIIYISQFILGFIIFLSFPFLALKYGLIIFSICYIIMFFILTLPLMLLELSIGQYFNVGVFEFLFKNNKLYIFYNCAYILMFSAINNIFNIIYLLKFINIIYFENYYKNIYEYFNFRVLLKESNHYSFKYQLFYWLFLLLLLYFFLKFKHFYNNIIVNIMNFIVIISWIIILIMAILYGYSNKYLMEILQFDIKIFLNYNLWIDASQQVIFQLSAGWGLLINLSRNKNLLENCLKQSKIIFFVNFTFSVIITFIIFLFIKPIKNTTNLKQIEDYELILILIPQSIRNNIKYITILVLFYLSLILVCLSNIYNYSSNFYFLLKNYTFIYLKKYHKYIKIICILIIFIFSIPITSNSKFFIQLIFTNDLLNLLSLFNTYLILKYLKKYTYIIIKLSNINLTKIPYIYIFWLNYVIEYIILILTIFKFSNIVQNIWLLEDLKLLFIINLIIPISFFFIHKNDKKNDLFKNIN